MSGKDDCVTPWKMRFESRAQAKQFIREIKRKSRKVKTKSFHGSLRPYPCGDHWHWSTMTGAEIKRVGTRTKTARRNGAA